MSQIILDISANTHHNDWQYLKRMLDELKAVDTGKHEVVIKHQLFQKAGDNIPLDYCIFDKAYKYAEELGYKTTSSVFDKESLDFLLRYDVPFVKIANNKNYYWLIGEIQRKIPVYVSGSDKGNVNFCCVSKYPAVFEEYLHFGTTKLCIAISDHTTDWRLFREYYPDHYECHYKLQDSTGLDAGIFARTPEQLSQIL